MMVGKYNSFNHIVIGILTVLSLLPVGAASAQTIQSSSYQTVAHIQSDGTVQNASYRIIGHADGIPMKWAAFYFFFSK